MYLEVGGNVLDPHIDRMVWITLNDTTLRIDEILSIEMMMEMDEYIFTVICKTLKPFRVNLHATGGKWLYMICHQGLEEAKRGGILYERL
jgi:hypothetical protein